VLGCRFPTSGVTRIVERAAASLPESSHLSVWLGEPDAAPVLAREELHPHYAASTMKLPLLVAAYLAHESGRLDLDSEVTVRNEFRSAYDGSTFSLHQHDDQDDETWARLGTTVTLRALARHATVRSGNLATDLLLESIGTDAVAAVLRAAGCSERTSLPRGIGDVAARQAGLENLVTAADLARVLGAVAIGRLGSPETCADIERVLAAQEHRDQIPAGLPPGTYVANKTGWVDGVAHDVALVRPTRHPAYLLAVCSTADVDEQVLYAVSASVSAAVWEGWTG